ncbi:MAG: hypothetical protein WB992_08375 [Bryobacteraceae bacterium]
MTKKPRKIPILEQWIEVRVEAGQAITKLFPPNERLIEEGKDMDPQPELVYRRLTFFNGVPKEYHWATHDEHARQYGGSGIQRMTVNTWLKVIQAEKAAANGHIGPCGGNLPRSQDRGGCDCTVCTYNQYLLDQAKA